MHCDAVGVRVTDGDTEELRHVVTDSVTDTVPDTETVTDSEDVNVDPAGAQKGPMLNVDRCVPPSDASGDADLTDGDPVADARTVANVRVTDTVTDVVLDTEEHADRVLSDGDDTCVRDSVPDADRDGLTVEHTDADAKAVGFVRVTVGVSEVVTDLVPWFDSFTVG